MKIFQFTKDDAKRLLAVIDRDPEWGQNGGSSQSLTEQERRAYREAHRFYNYQIRTWLSSITEGEF